MDRNHRDRRGTQRLGARSQQQLEDPHRAGGLIETEQPRFGERGARTAACSARRVDEQDRFADGLLRAGHGAGRLLHVRLRGHQIQPDCRIGIIHHRGKGVAHRVAVVGITAFMQHAQIDRQLAASFGQQRLEPPPRGRCKLGQPQPVLRQRIGQQRGSATRTGKQRDAVSTGSPHAYDRFGQPQQIECIIDQHHTVRVAYGAHDIVGPGRAGGVRGDGAFTDGRAPGLGEQHRLAARAGALCCHGETLRPQQPFDVKADDLRARIVDEVLEEIAQLQVALIAHRHARGKSCPEFVRLRDQRTHQRAGLAGQTDRAGRQAQHVSECKRCRQRKARVRVDQAEAVRPEQPHAVAARDLRHRFLTQFTFAPGLGELRRDDDARAHTGFGAFAHRVDGAGGRYGEDRHVDRRGRVLDRSVGDQPLHHARARPDRHDAALVPMIDQVFENAAAPFLGVVGGAQHRHRLRIEQALQ